MNKNKMSYIKLLTACVITSLFMATNIYAEETKKVVVDKEALEKSMPRYMDSLEKIMKEAEKKIEILEKELRAEEEKKKDAETEALAREHYENGNALYEDGKLRDARAEWKKALSVTKDLEMKGYIKEQRREYEQADAARKKAEKEAELARAKAEKAAALAKERAAREQRKVELKAKLEKEKAEREVKLAQARKNKEIELKKRQAELAARKAARKAELERKNAEREAELSRKKAERDAELARKKAELSRKKAERDAELARKKEAAGLYRSAIALYQHKRYSEALAKFKEAESKISGYSNAEYYIKRIPKDIKREVEKLKKKREETQAK